MQKACIVVVFVVAMLLAIQVMQNMQQLAGQPTAFVEMVGLPP